MLLRQRRGLLRVGGVAVCDLTADARSGPGGELYLYSSDRVGLYLGNGLLVFSTRAFDLAELYGRDAIVEVEGDDEFVDKLRYYAEHDAERQRVARAGYEIAHREFNERLVSQYMIETALGLPHSHDYRWPLAHFGR